MPTYPDLAAALSDGQELVGPMSEDELRLAIEHPAALVGCTMEPGLSDLLLQDVRGQAGALPLLEYTLLDLWRQRQGSRLTIAAYCDMGGVQGALEHRADVILEGFRSRPGELEICRRIFLRLTQPGEGTEDTKCRAAFDELIASEAERPTVEEVVRKLADARLIITNGGGAVWPAWATPRYVEVAHEALIRGWTQFRQWIDADRAGLIMHRRLAEAARDWQYHNRDESYLYVGSRLHVAREWSEAHAPDLNLVEREFLDASLAEAKRKPSPRIARRTQTQRGRRFRVKTGKGSSRPLRVFLCHSSGDKPFVRDLYKRLLDDGIKPWLDEMDLPPGCDWELEISNAVREIDLVIVCLSIGAASKAGFIQKEIKFALDVAEQQPQGEIFVIPLKLDSKCIIPERLRRWQWVNYFEESGHEKLLQGLETRVKSLNQRLANLDY